MLTATWGRAGTNNAEPKEDDNDSGKDKDKDKLDNLLMVGEFFSSNGPAESADKGEGPVWDQAAGEWVPAPHWIPTVVKD